MVTFGRLRPIHVNGVIWGAFSTLFIGLATTSCRACAACGCGASGGLPATVDLEPEPGARRRPARARHQPRLGGGRAAAAQRGDHLRRPCISRTAPDDDRPTEKPLYVSLWYLIGAFVWTDINLVLLMLGPYHIPGINNAAFHGLFIHYVVGLWITPAGYVLIYYFLPASVRDPIYSHKLSLIGFWSLAFFYPFVGIHHYLYSPIADWAETIAIVSSMMLIIPVWTVLQNFFGTMNGRWEQFGPNLPAKFLIMGSLMYLVGCFQGSLEALRSLQQPTHFTDFVISHSHLTVFGTFVMWAIAGSVYVWPRLRGARAVELPARQLGLLAHHAGHLGHGARAHRPGAAAGLHADRGRGVGGLHRRHPALLVGPHVDRYLDGHRHVAADLQLDADGARRRPRRSA